MKYTSDVRLQKACEEQHLEHLSDATGESGVLDNCPQCKEDRKSSKLFSTCEEARKAVQVYVKTNGIDAGKWKDASSISPGLLLVRFERAKFTISASGEIKPWETPAPAPVYPSLKSIRQETVYTFSGEADSYKDAEDFSYSKQLTGNVTDVRLVSPSFGVYEVVVETVLDSDDSEVCEPDIDDSVKACPECERPNQFGELCGVCIREIDAEREY